jgi:hypothetical protein
MQAGLNSQGIYSTYSGPPTGGGAEHEESSASEEDPF